MIRSFGGLLAEELFLGIYSENTKNIEPSLRFKMERVLDYLNILQKIDYDKVPGFDNFGRFVGGVKGDWVLHLEEAWRISFRWFEGDVYNVHVTQV